MSARARVRVCARARAHVYVRACVRVCVCVYVRVRVRVRARVRVGGQQCSQAGLGCVYSQKIASENSYTHSTFFKCFSVCKVIHIACGEDMLAKVRC